MGLPVSYVTGPSPSSPRRRLRAAVSVGSDHRLWSYRVGEVHQVFMGGGRLPVVRGQLAVMPLQPGTDLALLGGRSPQAPRAAARVAGSVAAAVQCVQLPFVQFGAEPQHLVLGETGFAGARGAAAEAAQ